MSKSQLLALAFAGFLNGSLASEIYLRFDFNNYAEPTSIGSFLHEFDGDFEGGTQAFAHEWMETGIRSGAWEVGVFSRYDYDLSFSEDLAELYYLATNKLPLEIGKSYNIDLSAKYYRTDGIRVGHTFKPNETLQATIGVAYLRGHRLTDGQLTGSAVALSDDDYDFSFQTDYYYSEDPLFDREVEAPTGWGYSADLSLDWKPNPFIALNLQVYDLFGRIFWDQAPHTIATANSDNKTYDDDGYVEFTPTLSGQEEYRDFEQTLNPFGSMRASFRVYTNLGLLYQEDFTSETNFSGYGASYIFDSHQSIALLYHPETKAWEIEYYGPYWKLRLAGDALSQDQSNLIRLSGNFSYPF